MKSVCSWSSIVEKTVFFIILAIFFCTPLSMAAPQYIDFKADDGITVTADVYLEHDLVAPFIILFHQAGWSRGEYLEIAPRLNQMGFNCIAVDQRAGNSVKGIDNRTFINALRGKKHTTFVDAYQDMVATLKFVKRKYAQGKVIIWGSSYSASLCVRLAGEHPDMVDAVLAFSPGEYFVKFGLGKKYITNFAKKIICPVFVTSSQREASKWKPIFAAISGEKKYSFVPETKGNHGSRALWEQYDDSGAYWEEVSKFLKENFQI